MQLKKIIIFSLLLLVSLSTISNINAEELSYIETNKTVTNLGNIKKVVYEGKTQETGFSSAKQVMTFAEFNKNDNLELVHWNYNSGTNWRLKNIFGLAEDYELNNPGHKVLAGINGDFFSMSSPYEPLGTQISNYELLRSGWDSFDTIGIDNNNEFAIQTSAFNFSTNFYLRVYDENGYIVKEVKVDKTGAVASEGQTTVYLPGYEGDIDCSGSNVCYNVKNAKYRKSQSNESNLIYYMKGEIDNTNDYISELTDLQFTIRTQNQELIDLLKKGLTVSIQKITDSKFDTFKSAGGYAGNLIKNNVIQEYINMGGPDHQVERHPRTVLGFKANGDIMMGCIDGRNSSLNRNGVTLREAAKVLNYYGCENAVAFDGGGSSNIIIRENGELKLANIVSNSGQELRNVADAWFIVEKDCDISLKEKLASSNSKTFDVSYFNKDKIKEAYIIFNGKRSKFDLSLNEIKIDFEKGKNFLYFEICYSNNKKIISDLTIIDSNNVEVTKIPPTDFKVVEGSYKDGVLKLKFDYFDNAKMITKVQMKVNDKAYHCKLSTQTCELKLEDNNTYYVTFYYEYYNNRKEHKETYYKDVLVQIKDSEVKIINDFNSVMDYLIGGYIEEFKNN